MRTATMTVLRSVLLAIVVAGGTPALDAGDLAFALQPDYTSADLAILVEDLELNADQHALVAAHLADYAAAFDRGAGELRRCIAEQRARPSTDADRRETMQALRRAAARLREETRLATEQAADAETRRQVLARYHAEIRALQDRLRGGGAVAPTETETLNRVLAGLVEQWETTRRAQRAAFEADLVAILTDTQRERWPAAERRLRRARALPRGVLSGESTDLFRIVRELELTPTVREQMRPLLVQFDVDLDAALRARDDPSARALLREIPTLDAETRAAAAERRLAQHVAVREVNEQMAAALTAALPPAAARSFRERVRQATYASVFRPTREMRILRAARELDGLDADVRGAVAAMERAYLLELAPLNERHCALIVEHERVRVRRRLDGDDAASDDTPLREAIAARRALGARYLDRLQALLPADAYARLPGLDGDGVDDGLIGQAWVRERFDEDGDGVLSPGELDRLRAYLARDSD